MPEPSNYEKAESKKFATTEQNIRKGQLYATLAVVDAINGLADEVRQLRETLGDHLDQYGNSVRVIN